jgi:hypothetical protein
MIDPSKAPANFAVTTALVSLDAARACQISVVPHVSFDLVARLQVRPPPVTSVTFCAFELGPSAETNARINSPFAAVESFGDVNFVEAVG